MSSFAEAAGTVILAGLEGLGMTDAERSFFKRIPSSGITVFKRNIPDPYQSLSVTLSELQSLRASHLPPMLVAIDQEGGRVSRLPPAFINHGPAMDLAEGGTNGAALLSIENYAFDVGVALKQLGVNLNFAPVVDILTEPTNHAIGNRCFGTSADAVSLRAGSYLKGLTRAGVLGCLKHFPGQGDAKNDTHVASAVIDLDFELLWNRELKPYRDLLESAPMVMISHCIYPALSLRPASLAPEVMNGLLRRQMGFGGLVVSDDMNMEAVPQDLNQWSDRMIEALVSGADLLLVCRHIEKAELAYEAIVKEARRSPAFATLLMDAAGRVLRVRNRLAN